MSLEEIKSRFRNLPDPQRIGYLIGCSINGTLSIEERDELDEWYAASEDNMDMFDELTEDKNVEAFLQFVTTLNVEASLAATRSRMQVKQPTPVLRLGTWIAAASILALLATSVYFIINWNKRVAQPVTELQQDVEPGSAVASLRIHNGRVIPLDGVKDSAIDKHVKIKDGVVTYDNANTSSEQHELIVPRKGFYQLILPDKSQVWINSASSIIYPSRFEGPERRVRVTGETFFKVAHDPNHPFIVEAGNSSITALGTAFNVNAYSTDLKATLTEGSIKVVAAGNERIIKPGQEISISNNSMDVQNIDTRPVIAWIDNRFTFSNNTLEEIMPLLERWYDVNVTWQDKIDFHFNGVINRSLPLSKVLRLLEETGHAHFIIKGTNITVTK